MQKTALPLTKTDTSIPVSRLVRCISDWHSDCRIQQHSPHTINGRQIITNKLMWFLEGRGYEVCGPSELRAFFAYLTTGHEEAGGRWGNPQLLSPMRPCTVHMYYSRLKAFFNWLVSDGFLDSSPMDKIKAPVARADQVQPFTPDQIEALYQAARRSRHPRRDEAILLFLLDTGLRASELCSLKMKDIDINGRRLYGLG